MGVHTVDDGLCRHECSAEQASDPVAFFLLVAEVTQDYNTDYAFTPEAIEALQVLVEAEIISYLALSRRMLQHRDAMIPSTRGGFHLNSSSSSSTTTTTTTTGD